MKSSLPLFLLIGGVLVVSLIGFIIFNFRTKGGSSGNEKEEVAAQVPAPYITLTPNSAGQVLSLTVGSIDPKAATLEYELVYNTDKGVLQGVPGSVDLEGKQSLTRDLTLGTCSSGVCRYDKGVKDISLTIRLRNNKGKLLGKFAGGVALLSKTRELESSDSKFELILNKQGTGFYIVMQTGKTPGSSPGEVVAGPYGVFASGNVKQSGKVTLTGGAIYVYDETKWTKLTDGKASTLGTFVGTKE